MDLKKRWTESLLSDVVKKLKLGNVPASPFGVTEFGKVDLRGITVSDPLIFRNLEVNDVDISHSSFFNVLFMNCTLQNWDFFKTKVRMLNNGSRFINFNFTETDLLTSSCGGVAEFIRCTFNTANLKGCIFKEGKFSNCKIKGSKLEKIEFGSVLFDSCTFIGNFKKCFFRGAANHCDFSNSTFLDCAFYGIEFHNCTFSDKVILFKNWQSSYKIILDLLKTEPLSNDCRKFIQEWCGAWGEVNKFISQELIDRQNLIDQSNPDISTEAFEFYRKVESLSV